MPRVRIVLLIAVGVSLGCTDLVTTPRAMPDGVTAARAPSGPAPRYKLRFVWDTTASNPMDGEIQSGWFPDTGVLLNTRSPWKSLAVRDVTIDLVDHTHGSWTAGTCATFRSSSPINVTNWIISQPPGDDPTTALSYAGRWFGALAISQKTGTSVSFDGDRVPEATAPHTAGGIHNVVTNGNVAIETMDHSGRNEWFRLTIRDAAMKFGSASTPDGSSNPFGVEVACANFAIEARLVTP